MRRDRYTPWAGTLKAAGLAMVLLAAPASAGDDKPEKPVTDDSVSIGDAATSPMADLNIRKDEIPDILVQARKAPYERKHLRNCGQIAAAIGELDAVLGEDLDIAEREGRSFGAGEIAKMAVGSFIPFRGLIRQLSGAKKHEQEFRDAIIAGMMRRSFLKGIGLQKGCRYPARPAPPEVIEAIAAREKAEAEAEAAREEAKKRDKKRDREDRKNGDDEPGYISEPVVQPVS